MAPERRSGWCLGLSALLHVFATGLHNEFAACINGFLQTERGVPFVADLFHTMETPNMHQAMHGLPSGET